MTRSALERLRSDVAVAATPESKAEALLTLALCLAQLGKVDEAKLNLRQVREEYSSGRAPRVSIRLLMLEGVVSYYENLADSTDRLRRAHALARAIGAPDLCAEVSVWIAHLAFNFERYGNLATALDEVFENFSCLDDSLKARACLLVADGVQFLGDTTVAANWYTAARVFARQCHDHAMMAAIEYNRLGMGLSRIRIERALRFKADGATRRQWLVEMESVKRLHMGLDVRALSELIDLCHAYTHELLEEFSEAASSLRAIQAKGVASRCGVSDALLAVEIAWCEAKLNRVDSSARERLLSLDFIETLDANEQLLALSFFEDITDLPEGAAEFFRYKAIREVAVNHLQGTSLQIRDAMAVAYPYFEMIAAAARIRIPNSST